MIGPRSTTTRGRAKGLLGLVAGGAAGALVASTLAFGNPAGAEFGVREARSIDQACPEGTPASAFTDVPPVGDPFRRAIDCVGFYKITQGTGNGSTYSPGNNVTRAQMASFLIRTLGTTDSYSRPASPPDQFQDDAGQVAEADINALAAEGIVSGTGPGTYNPTGNVTRAQMALFLERLIIATLAELPVPEDDYFPDDNGGIAEDSINVLAEIGVVSGSTNGTYGPGAQVTRSQMALFLARTVDYLTDQGIVFGPR